MKNLTLPKIFTIIVFVISAILLVTNVFGITNFGYLNIFGLFVTPFITMGVYNILTLLSHPLETMFSLLFE